MAVEIMRPVRIDGYNDRNDNFAWEYRVRVSKIDTTDWVLVPVNVDRISVALVFNSVLSAYVEYTINKLDDVINGAGVTAFMWEPGLVFDSEEDYLLPKTAIRLVVPSYTAGSVTMILRAQ